jgi:hypothetical protein
MAAVGKDCPVLFGADMASVHEAAPDSLITGSQFDGPGQAPQFS